MSRQTSFKQFVSLLCALGLGFSFAATCAEPEIKATLPPALSWIQSASQQALDKIDQSIATAAKKLASIPDLKSDDARKILSEMHKSSPFSIDCCIISPEGKMIVIEPSAFKRFEGSDILKQEHVSRMIKTHAPVMSDQFKTVEGIPAVDIEHPIMTVDGKLAGSVSMIFQPHALLQEIIPPLIKGLPVEAWGMQRDGRIIYDADADEVGRMLFSDKIYEPFPELLNLGGRISAEPDGYGSYNYFKTGTKDKVTKETWWTTIGLHGTDWRLVQTHPMGDANKYLSIAQAPATSDALKKLAGNIALAKALTRNDREVGMTIFKNFAMSYSGVYSISWIDAKGVSQFGYPPENSLTECDLNKDNSLSSAFCATSIKARTEGSCEDKLLEGGRARFTFVPMNDGEVNIGGLLLIQRL